MQEKTILFQKNDADAALATAPTQGKHALKLPDEFSRLPFTILEDTAVDNEPEVHKHEGDLWYCLEGEVIFIYGGELIDQYEKTINGVLNVNELGGSKIKGGKEIMLHSGDWLWIPPGVPHRHGTQSTARMVIIKIHPKTT